MNDDDGVTRDHMPSEMTSTEGGRVRRKGKRSDVVFPRGVRPTERPVVVFLQRLNQSAAG